MRIIFIRHGKTKGNTEGRYVGRTEEPLLAESVASLQKTPYPAVQRVITSPMLRCRQTAEAIYPTVPVQVQWGLEEMDFGEFEYKNYLELCGDWRYQTYIDSGGQTSFPGAEPLDVFKERCCAAFREAMERLQERKTGENEPSVAVNGKAEEPSVAATGGAEEQARTVGQIKEASVSAVAFVVHGGTIMAIMEAFGEPKRGYFDWQIANGAYIEGEYSEGKIKVNES